MSLFSDKQETSKEELTVEEIKAMWLCPKCRGRKWKDRQECFGCTIPSDEELKWEGRAVNESRHRSWLIRYGWRDERAVDLQGKCYQDRKGGAYLANRAKYGDNQTFHNGAYGR